jgi:hypothetical protein
MGAMIRRRPASLGLLPGISSRREGRALYASDLSGSQSSRRLSIAGSSPLSQPLCSPRPGKALLSHFARKRLTPGLSRQTGDSPNQLVPRTIGQSARPEWQWAHMEGLRPQWGYPARSRRRFATLTRYALTAPGARNGWACRGSAQPSRWSGSGGGQAHAAAPARGPVATPRQGPAPRSYAVPRAVAPRGVAPYRAPGYGYAVPRSNYGYAVPRSNYGYAVPRSNGYYHGGGAWRGYYPHGGYYGHGHSYGYGGYGYGYWRPYPYYSFYPHFNIVFVLYLGYRCRASPLLVYPRPCAAYGSARCPVSVVSGTAPYPYGNQYPQQQPYQQPYQQPIRTTRSNLPRQHQQGSQQNTVDVTPGGTAGSASTSSRRQLK